MKSNNFQKRIAGRLGDFSSVSEDDAHYVTFPQLSGELGPTMFFDGKEMLVWSINDYIGIASHPVVKNIESKAVQEYGLSYPMGSRIMSGNLPEHELLEDNLAAFAGKDKSMLFNLGYPGAFSIVDALLSRHDIVIYDEQCHASTIDGVRLHRGKHFKYKHNDIASLRDRLIKAATTVGPDGYVLVITEGVFSMTGDQGRLKEIFQLKQEFDFLLLVDDSHGFGILGQEGRGTGSEQQVQDNIDFYFATFTKAIGTIGAFLAADTNTINYLQYTARSQVYGRALPMVCTLSLLKRLEITKQSDRQRAKAMSNASLLRKKLQSAGFDTMNSDSSIVPVLMHMNLENAKRSQRILRDRYQIFCSGVTHPVIPKGQIIFRLVATASHSEEQVLRTVDAFTKVKRKLESTVELEMQEK